MNPQEQYWKERCEALVKSLVEIHTVSTDPEIQRLCESPLLEINNSQPPAPAQGVEEADEIIREIYNRCAALNGDKESDPFGDLLKGTGKADKQVLSFVRELFIAGSRWQQEQGLGERVRLDRPDKIWMELSIRVPKRTDL